MPQEEAICTERLAAHFVKGAEFASLNALRSGWRSCWDTIGAQILAAGLGVISGLLLPRLLGPQARGELAAVTLWPVSLAFLGSIGIDRATVFVASKHREDFSPVAASSFGVAAAQSLLVILVGLFIIPVALKGHGPQIVRLGIVFLFAVPVIQVNSVQVSLLLAGLQTKSYNACRILPPAVYAIGVLTLFLVRIPSIRAIVLLQVLGITLAAILAFRMLSNKLRLWPRWDRLTLKSILAYGLKTHAGQVTYFMNQRLDQLLISLFLSSAYLGIYVASVAFADALLIVPRAIGAVTLAMGSNCDPMEAWQWAKRSLLLTCVCLVPAAVALWLLAPVVIPALFGPRFVSSVLPCRILIIGSLGSALSTVLGEAARSINHPEIPGFAELAGLVATVGLLAMLLKPYGPTGAAIASSVAYTVILIVNIWYSIRVRRELRPV